MVCWVLKGRMDGFLNFREFFKFIVENSWDVFIDSGGVWRVVELLLVKVVGLELCVEGWKVFYELNFRVVDEVVVNWVFVIDMFNFFFWLE